MYTNKIRYGDSTSYAKRSFLDHGVPVVLEKPFVGLKGPLIGSWDPPSKNKIF